jgi:hypothetical protein
MHKVFQLARLSLALPSRHPRLAVAIGRLLGLAFTICFLTGLYSHFIQHPLPWMFFPDRPVWLYRVSQGLHVTAGLACIPLLLGKLYTVFPLLFKWPPFKGGFVTVIERASITLFVSSSLVQLGIGVLDIYQWYIFPFNFLQVHYALAYIIIASLAIHIAFKLPIITRWWRKKDSVDDSGDLLPVEEGELTLEDSPTARGLTGIVYRWIDKQAPQAPQKVSRRTVLGGIGAGAAVIFLTTSGQTIPALDKLNILGPRKIGVGPQKLSVNKTARSAGVAAKAYDPNWLLTLKHGKKRMSLTLSELEAMPQYTVSLPIACVEGWSQDAVWTGIRFSDIAKLLGAEDNDFMVQSLQKGGYGRTKLEKNFVNNDQTLIALKLNGDRLSLDHGYPARLIAPARPGVLQTKWLSSLEVL